MLKEDNDLYNQLIIDFQNLTSENFSGAYELSQRALILSDRWNDMGLEVEKLAAEKGTTKTIVGDWIYNRYRICSKIHDQSRMVWSKGEEQAMYWERNANKRG